MLFNSFIFFIFLALVLPIHYGIRTNRGKVLFLVLVSYLFYSYWDWRFSILILFSTLVDFVIARKLESTQQVKSRKWLLGVSLFVNLGVLAFFKYFNFFIDSFKNLIEQLGFEYSPWYLNVLLPVGISFYTFQTLSYTIDVYRGNQKAEKNFLNFALYVCFFPQLVAGPIERAENLLKQFKGGLKATSLQWKEGFHLLAIGLFKKVMIGDAAARIVDPIFADYSYYNGLELFAALLLFSVQIYADFSGYTSIARGVAKWIGVDLIKNFDEPYLSRNITEFWRRWHISLSSWLRDYLYIPLGGNRKGSFNTYRNLLITMLLGGLWHGANWTFVIWGGLHGVYLLIDKWIKGKNKSNGVSQALRYRDIPSIILTFGLVLITWLFFRAENVQVAFDIIDLILSFESSEEGVRLLGMSLSFMAIILGIDLMNRKAGTQVFLPTFLPTYISNGILFILMVVSFIFMFQNKAMPFIYFQF